MRNDSCQKPLSSLFPCVGIK
uniref:Uncharacterized protein n=1 Tax=Anguilla anguilla TaxID=7936 RepID=A0A0E9VC60_ANGAN